MKIESLALSQIFENKKNPRHITESKFKKLVNSVLSLPQMLEIRPIVVDDSRTVLGGNMRLMALREISKMSQAEVEGKLSKIRDVEKKSPKEQESLKTYWKKWVLNPTVQVINANTLTKAEQKEFVIKDNGDFGSWDYDVLANEWNADDLNDWGVDVWQTSEVEDVFNANLANGNEEENVIPSESQNGEQTEFEGTLPPELQGVDLEPNNLPKIQGTDETKLERIIIVYRKEREPELLGLLGMADINKIVYHLDEIIGNTNGEE